MHRRHFLRTSLGLFAATATHGRAAEPATAAEAFDAEMEAFMDPRGVPGGALAVVKNRRLVYAKGYGLADRAVRPAARWLELGGLFQSAFRRQNPARRSHRRRPPSRGGPRGRMAGGHSLGRKIKRRISLFTRGGINVVSPRSSFRRLGAGAFPGARASPTHTHEEYGKKSHHRQNDRSGQTCCQAVGSDSCREKNGRRSLEAIQSCRCAAARRKIAPVESAGFHHR